MALFYVIVSLNLSDWAKDNFGPLSTMTLLISHSTNTDSDDCSALSSLGRRCIDESPIDPLPFSHLHPPSRNTRLMRENTTVNIPGCPSSVTTPSRLHVTVYCSCDALETPERKMTSDIHSKSSDNQPGRLPGTLAFARADLFAAVPTTSDILLTPYITTAGIRMM